jgi:hypothetical protein
MYIAAQFAGRLPPFLHAPLQTGRRPLFLPLKKEASHFNYHPRKSWVAHIPTTLNRQWSIVNWLIVLAR